MSLLQVDNVSQAFRQPGRRRRRVADDRARRTARRSSARTAPARRRSSTSISGFFAPTSGAHPVRRRGHHRACAGAARLRAAWRAPSRSPKSFPSFRSRENLRIAVEVAAGLPADALARPRGDGRSRRAGRRPAGHGRPRATRPDGCVGELSHGDQRATEIMMSLALQPAPAAARRADRRHGRPGNLRHRPAHPPPAPRAGS